jgi:methyltransferase (TIGR00027 family)
MIIKSTESIQLPDVAETALLTFYCHAIESQSPQPILRDEKAVEITHLLNPILANSSSLLLQNLAAGKIRQELVVHIVLRAKKFDDYAQAFLKIHPDGIIVNLGSGLDSRCKRIDDGRVTVVDLDLPEMMTLKKRFFEESNRYIQISSSVFDYDWMDQVAKLGCRPTLFLAEGLFMYLPAEKVKELILKLQSRFPGCELACEVVTEFFVRKPWNRLLGIKMQRQLKVGREATYHFGLKNSHEMESWHAGIQFLDDWSYFDTRHPRLGWVGNLGKLKLMRQVQWTVHYRLN